MIPLAELKSYANITGTDKDAALQGFINSATSILNKNCNRVFLRNDYTEVIKSCNFTDKLYLSNAPINEVTSIKYWDGEEYTDLLSSPDTIENSIENYQDYLLLRKGYSFYGKDIQVEYNAGYTFQVGTGKVKQLNGETSVIGLGGTQFESEIEVGDYICFDGLKRLVSAVDDDTHLTVTEAVTEDHLSSAFTISNVPYDIEQACKELACKLFYDSGMQGANGTLLVSSKSGETSYSYKEFNMDEFINANRFVNI